MPLPKTLPETSPESYRCIHLLAALSALLIAACTDEPPAPPAAPASAASSPFVASAKGRIDIEGGVIRLAAQREGVIDKVLVEEGDTV